MKAISVILSSIILAACDQSKPSSANAPKLIPAEPSSVTSQSKYPDHFDSAWIDGSGFMGIAIAISGERYFYWFYSDVNPPSEPEYPYTGTFKTEGDVMELGFPTSLPTGRVVLIDGTSELYSYRWKIVRSGDSVRLHSERVGSGLSLVSDPHFDPNEPFRNQNTLKP